MELEFILVLNIIELPVKIVKKTIITCNGLKTVLKTSWSLFDSRVKQINELSKLTSNPPIITCPYDAELYGHWWYEGPDWLYVLFKKVYYDNCNFKLITPSEYIDKYPSMQVCTPCRSSWGANGYSEVWLNQTNDYAHKYLHDIGNKMVELANKLPDERIN